MKQGVGFIPYKIVGGKIYIFLQKRTLDAPTRPGQFSTFGGGAEEGEAPEDTLVREVKEELNYTTSQYLLLGLYSARPNISAHIYYEKVSDDWEKTIDVREGDFGKFFNEKEVENEQTIDEQDKTVFRELFLRIKNLE